MYVIVVSFVSTFEEIDFMIVSVSNNKQQQTNQQTTVIGNTIIHVRSPIFTSIGQNENPNGRWRLRMSRAGSDEIRPWHFSIIVTIIVFFLEQDLALSQKYNSQKNKNTCSKRLCHVELLSRMMLLNFWNYCRPTMVFILKLREVEGFWLKCVKVADASGSFLLLLSSLMFHQAVHQYRYNWVLTSITSYSTRALVVAS